MKIYLLCHSNSTPQKEQLDKFNTDNSEIKIGTEEKSNAQDRNSETKIGPEEESNAQDRNSETKIGTEEKSNAQNRNSETKTGPEEKSNAQDRIESHCKSRSSKDGVVQRRRTSLNAALPRVLLRAGPGHFTLNLYGQSSPGDKVNSSYIHGAALLTRQRLVQMKGGESQTARQHSWTSFCRIMCLLAPPARSLGL